MRDKMIIDAHSHLGNVLNFHMTDFLLPAIKKYGVDFSLVSNLEAVEVDQQMNDLPKEEQIDEIEVNQKALDFVKENQGMFGLLYWCKPRTHGLNQETIDFIKKNRSYIYGLKFHPFYSNMPLTDKRIQPYFDLAKELHLSICVHTANDTNSYPKYVIEMARRNPSVKIVMAHLNLGGSCEEAIQAILNTPNLYGDTAWVSKENALAIMKKDSKKLLFGTDNPIDGIDTYLKYNDYFHSIKEELTESDYKRLMVLNAIEVYGIKRKDDK